MSRLGVERMIIGGYEESGDWVLTMWEVPLEHAEEPKPNPVEPELVEVPGVYDPESPFGPP